MKAQALAQLRVELSRVRLAQLEAATRSSMAFRPTAAASQHRKTSLARTLLLEVKKAQHEYGLALRSHLNLALRRKAPLKQWRVVELQRWIETAPLGALMDGMRNLTPGVIGKDFDATSWGHGFLVGREIGSLAERFNTPNNAIDSTGPDSLYERTERAWLSLVHDKPANRKGPKAGQIIAKLADHGVRLAEGKLCWQSEDGIERRMSEGTFRNNLGRWIRDFHERRS